MILLGKKQELLIVKKVEFGVYLAEKAGAKTGKARRTVGGICLQGF